MQVTAYDPVIGKSVAFAEARVASTITGEEGSGERDGPDLSLSANARPSLMEEPACERLSGCRHRLNLQHLGFSFLARAPPIF
jgi:hypothetical protein